MRNPSDEWPSVGEGDPLHQRAHQKALRRVRELCLAMPDTGEKISRGHIPIITVGGKNFCIFWRADKRPNACVNAAVGAQEAYVKADPERYFVPAYMGVRGWLGIRLDGDVDWKALTDLLRESYRLSAPKAKPVAKRKARKR